MTTTVRRRWLIAALVVAVAVLLGSILAVAGWSGAFGQATAGTTRTGFDSGVTQFGRGDGYGPGMMGGNRRLEASAERRSDCLEFMRGWEGN